MASLVEHRFTALDQFLQNAAIRDWQRNNPVLGKPDASPDIRDGAEDEGESCSQHGSSSV